VPNPPGPSPIPGPPAPIFPPPPTIPSGGRPYQNASTGKSSETTARPAESTEKQTMNTPGPTETQPISTASPIETQPMTTADPTETQPMQLGNSTRGRVATGGGALSNGNGNESGGNGLPAYTMPPATGSRPQTTTFGVGGSAPSGSPFGVTSTSTAPHDQNRRPLPAEDDPNATMAVPQQRNVPGGTVYGTGGYDVIDMTMPVSTTNPAVENSGSLTGHILAQGWRDEIVDRRRSNIKVAVAMLVVLGLLVTVSLVFLLTAGSAFTDMISKMFS
jgi:hypothetical protein